MSWLSSLISGPSDHRDSSKQMQARMRAATRAKLVKNLRDAAQGLATLETRQQQESGSLPTAGGAMGAVAPAPSEARGVPQPNRREQPLLSGDTAEVDAVCLALEQCLFHRIRVKDFGVIPLWAFLERVERAPLTTGNTGTGGVAVRTGSRERHLSSVRNTVGAVASFTEVATPLGRARAWIRQCLVSKCLESCVAALLEEERLVKVFYEPMALARCREGSTILLRLCAALEAFDVAVNADQSALDTPPPWPILEEEDEWDRRAEASAAASHMASASTPNPRTASAAPSHAHAYSSPGQTEATAAQRPQEEQKESLSWFQEQQQRRQREEVAGRSEGGWAASALSEIDQLANGDWNEQLDGVLAKVSSKVDQAVQSLDETINDMFGESNVNNASGNTSGKQDGWNGWVELDGGTAAPASALLDPEAAAAEAAAAREAAARAEAARKSGKAASAAAAWATPEAAAATARSPAAGYPGAFVMGSGGRRGGAKGRGRFFGARLEELVVNPHRCQRGMLDPALGVPDAFLSLIEALSSADCRGTPGLFLREASEEELVMVVKSLDKTNHLPGWDNTTGSIVGHSPAWLVSRLTGGSGGGGGHAEEKTGGRGGTLGGVSPHALASALVYFLHRLPEPLLTFRRREAFLACEAIPDLDARIRNVQLLVEDLPWAHQPLLLALAGLFADIAPQGEHVAAYPRQKSGRDAAAEDGGQHNAGGGGGGLFLTEGVTVVDETDLDANEQTGLDVIGDADVTGGVSIRDAAESLAPALLRYPPVTAGGVDGAEVRGRRPDWEEELAAAAVVELILGEHWRVLEGMRAEQARREKRLSRKVERLTQLTKMLGASVYLERPTHLAVVISIWRRLAQVEHEMQQEAAEGGEEALGLAPSGSWRDDSGGEVSRLGKDTAGAPPAVVAAAGRGAERKVPEAVDEDRDVRELESMLLDLEAEDEDDGYDNVPIAEFSAEDNAELSAAAAAAAAVAAAAVDAGEDGGGGPVTHSGGPLGGRRSAAYASAERVKGESDARASESAAAAAAGSDHAPLAFTIEEDDDAVDARAASGSGSSPSSRPAPNSSSAAAAASDYESTRALLGSIADSLTPPAAPGAGARNETEEKDRAKEGGGLLAATPSELALVNLMEEAVEEPGGLLPTADEDSCGDPDHRTAGGAVGVPAAAAAAAAQGLGASAGIAGGGGGIEQRRQPPGRLGSFEDALSAGSKAVGSLSETAGAKAGGGSSGNKPPAPIGDRGGGGGGSFRSIGSAQRVPTTKPDASGADGADPAGGGAVAEKEAPFSLGHRRWLTCGFTSAHTVGREGQEAESVGRALRDSASVLALDNMNYFLARYPRSAARAVKSCARRHAAAKGGGDSCPFPVHAGDVTRVIADLLSLQGHQQQQHSAEGAVGAAGSGIAAKERDTGVVESGDARALRLAALPTWPLLDSPHAFQEAFSCAVLVMEAAQAAKARGGHHDTMRYEATLLEMRKVLHACLLHAPTSVEAFWAAAAAEGGVSPDPGDMPTGLPSEEAGGGPPAEVGGGNGADGGGAAAAALRGELERSLGLSKLDLRGGDLPLLGDIAAAVTAAQTSGAATSASCVGGGETSADDRVTFRGDAPGASPSQGFDEDAHAAKVAATSDWLLAGETARSGMIDSIAAENCGGWRRSGTTLVDDGVFQARLLCPSQILSDAEARALSGHLPGTIRSSDWVSLYSNVRHGSSLTTLLARCAGWQPTLVVIQASVPPPMDLGTSGGSAENIPLPPVRTTSGGGGGGAGVGASSATVVVFGGYASGSPWKNMGRAFAGDGGSFLFSFSPDRRRVQGGGDNPPSVGGGRGGGGGGGGSRSAGGDSGLRVYPWAGSDRCFMTSSDEAGVGLGMGGGGDGGNFGFLLSADLRSGTTGPCETFGNPSLTGPAVASSEGGGGGSTGSVFDVLSLEVWGFRPAKAPEGLTRIAL